MDQAQRVEERKQLLLTRGEPAATETIADAVVIKNGNTFFLCRPDGNVPLGKQHGLGLYFEDTRFLRAYELRIAEMKPTPLVSSSRLGHEAIFELTNPDLRRQDGTLIEKQAVAIRWIRRIENRYSILDDRILFENLSATAVELPVSIEFEASFEDIYAVRGLLTQTLGEISPPRWEGQNLILDYRGADEIFRRLSIHFSQEPTAREGSRVEFHLRLEPNQHRSISIRLAASQAKNREELKTQNRSRLSLVQKFTGSRPSENRGSQWLDNRVEVKTDSLLLNEILDQSICDLIMLDSRIQDSNYFAAGLPWFGTLFGRDSLITALQTLSQNPQIAEHTLRLLAGMQGKVYNSWRDEEPGKILHELRQGEFARTSEIPHSPYYGSVDATPLFLIVLGRYCQWTGDLGLFWELRESVEAALDWIERIGDHDGDGYLDYLSSSHHGLINQGWKDSGNAIINQHGELATPPIALVEVQAYAYQARMAVADLFDRVSEPERARKLREDAKKLRLRFNRDFWMESAGTYALALHHGGKPMQQCAVSSSNAGHALWAGISDQRRAKYLAMTLMKPDLFSGWGIRTLSLKEKRFNPIGYHLGTVWPHDNAIIAAGLRNYGFDSAARKIATALTEAAMHFGQYRLPEVFAGFARNDYNIPVAYPVACHPQAWASGSMLYLLEVLLGLTPRAFDRELRIVRPMLPESVGRLELYGLRVGEAKVDLRFTLMHRNEPGRAESGIGNVAVEILSRRGNLKVVVEPTAVMRPEQLIAG